MENILGIVIPVFQRKFIRRCVSSVLSTVDKTKIRICIVNDGQNDLCGWLEANEWPEFVDILHLSENRGFAGANNAGWQFLIDRYPEINFLGSLNDDTKVIAGCFQELIQALLNYPLAGMVGAVQYVPQGFMGGSKGFALWRLGNVNGGQGMQLIASKIESDAQSAILPGHCFVCRKEALIAAGMFDEKYINSCDDVDLSLSIRKLGWDLYVVAKAVIIHYAGKSRYMSKASQEIHNALPHLIAKWGNDLSDYNDLSYFLRKQVDRLNWLEKGNLH